MTFTRPPVDPVGVSTPSAEGPAAIIARSPRSTVHAAWIGAPARVALYVMLGIVWPAVTVIV